MKKTVKVLSIVLLAMVILSTVLTIVAYADQVTPTSVPSKDIDQTSDILNLGGKIIGGVRVFGIVASVLILVILGVKYMLASPEGKADYKSNMIPYLVGAVLLFGATQIASLVYNTLHAA